MNHLLFNTLAIACLQALALTGHAHHGRDFVLLQDYTQPNVGDGNLTSAFEWSRTGGADEFTFEPGIFFAPIPRIAIGLTTSFIDEHDGWQYASVMPFAHLQLTPPDATFPVRIGLMAGYQFADADGSGGHTHDDEHATDEGEEEETGIHRHHASFLSAKLILETDLTASDKVVVNLINLTPESGHAVWGYAAGFRHSFSHAIGFGLEATGDFGKANQHELVLGAYISPSHALTLTVGVGFGLTNESPDFTLRNGVVWRF